MKFKKLTSSLIVAATIFGTCTSAFAYEHKEVKESPITKTNATLLRASVSSDWVAQLQDACNKEGHSNQIIDGYAGPNTLNGCPVLSEGDSGDVVRVLQWYLGSTFGILDSEIKNMYFGPKTKAAVKQFQQSKRLTADGIVGRNTWNAMLKPLY